MGPTHSIWLHDTRGRSRKFELRPLRDVFDADPGVFAFLRIENDKETVLYIGETANLRMTLYERPEENEFWDCVERNLATHIAVHKFFFDDKDRKKYAAIFREQYKPPC